jgi:hypothetical protein
MAKTTEQEADVEGMKQYGNGIRVAYTAKIYEAQFGWRADISYVLGGAKENLTVKDNPKAMSLELMLNGPGKCKARKKIERAIYLNL